MPPTRILWMSDSPTLCTGFGRVTREILTRLMATGAFDVACLGWGYEGWPYPRDEIPFDVYPSRPGSVGRDTLPSALEEFQPDVLITLGDIWMVEWIKDLPSRPPKVVAYVPIDGEPFYPPWVHFARWVDVLVTCSGFGERTIRQAIPEFQPRMIPHGADCEAFRPLPHRARPSLLSDRFVVGCVARNQPRKNLPALIEAFAKFSVNHPESLLYLHSDPEDVGWDLLDLVKRWNVFDRTCISAHASVRNGVSSAKLNEIYNYFDVMVLPTAGEGFGLPILEAMAAGVPVMATGYSSCVELLEGRGTLIDVQGFATAGRHNVRYAIPDIEDLVAKLEKLKADPGLAEAARIAGRAYAETLSWDAVVLEWIELLSELVTS